MRDNRTSYRVTSSYTSPIKLVVDVSRKSDESEPVIVSASIPTTGYIRGGSQVREAEERWSCSCWAVGRIEIVLLQLDCTNHQSVWEKPRDSAPRGLSGRSPLNTAATVP